MFRVHNTPESRGVAAGGTIPVAVLPQSWALCLSGRQTRKRQSAWRYKLRWISLLKRIFRPVFAFFQQLHCCCHNVNCLSLYLVFVLIGTKGEFALHKRQCSFV